MPPQRPPVGWRWHFIRKVIDLKENYAASWPIIAFELKTRYGRKYDLRTLDAGWVEIAYANRNEYREQWDRTPSAEEAEEDEKLWRDGSDPEVDTDSCGSDQRPEASKTASGKR